MPKPDKKQRHKAKRQAKRTAARRRQSVSPIKRLADAPGEIQCWMSEDFDLNGQMQIFVYKRAAGLTGLACFLIDRGVVGLKDAWTQLHIDQTRFDEALAGSAQQGIRMRRVQVEDARPWVAGGLRWAHDNGMRLPKDWAKTVLLIGGVDNWESADVSRFIKEFAGHPEDLRQRLITEPFESYITRSDIDFEFNDQAPYMDQKTGMYNDTDAPFDLDEEELESGGNELSEEELNMLIEKFTPAAMALAEETTQWLRAQNDTPSTELIAAWRFIMIAAMLSSIAMPNAPETDVADFGHQLLDSFANQIPDARFEEYERAVEQALRDHETDSRMMDKAIQKHVLTG